MQRDVLYYDSVVAHLLEVNVETIRRKARRGEIPGAQRRADGRHVTWLLPASWVGPAYADQRSKRRTRFRDNPESSARARTE